MAYKNPKQRKAYAQRWYQQNREQVLAQQKIYRDANKPKIAARHKRWYEANRERLLPLWRARRQAKRKQQLIARYQQFKPGVFKRKDVA